MTEKTAKTVRAVCGTVYAASAVFAGVSLMAACWGIYSSGGAQCFTPEKVAAAFSGISLGIYVFLALTVGAFLLEAVLPARPKAKSEAVAHMRRQRLAAGADMLYCGPQLKAAIVAQRKKRGAVTAAGIGILTFCSLVFLTYALNGSNFDDTDITGSVVRASVGMGICLLLPFAYGIFAAVFCKKSILAECELLKAAPKSSEPSPAAKSSTGWVRWVVLAAACGCLLYGLFAGGTVDVLTKAVNICTECVGLG